jgi:hypothetical protein
VIDLDPFDLPEWLGELEVTWTPVSAVRGSARVRGELSSGADRLACDLLAVDEAYPQPVAADGVRTRAHQAWVHGQVLTQEHDDRLTLLVPGTRLTADQVLDVIGRLAKAVGADPRRFAAHLRLGQ